MITPEEFLRIEIARGWGAENSRFNAIAKEVASQLIEFKPLKMIDYGAGMGIYANQLQRAGFDIVALDIWKPHRDYMKEHYPHLRVIADPIKSDFMLFIETAEHMKDEEINSAISIIDPDYIFFSSISTPKDNDEEWGHINLKPQLVWDSFWQDRGYTKIKDLRRPTSWTKIYQKI